MCLNLNKYLKTIDQFGVTFNHTIRNNHVQYKSAVGGILSLFLYSISFAYGIYIIYLWSDGRILSKISQQTEIVSYPTQQSLSHTPFTIQITAQQSVLEKLKDKKVFDVGVTIYTGTLENYGYELESTYKCPGLPGEDLISACLDLSKGVNHLVQDYTKGDTTIIVYLYKCDHTQDDKCISDDELNELAASKGSLWFRLITWQETIDYETGDSKFMPNLQYYFFDKDKQQQFFLNAIQSDINIDRGIIFPDETDHMSLNEFKIGTGQTEIEKGRYRTFHQKQAYAQVALSLSRQKNKIKVQFPKLGEIFAQVNAIIQIIMILRFFGFWLNQQLLEVKITQIVSTGYQLENKQLSIVTCLRQNLYKKLQFKSKNKVDDQRKKLKKYVKGKINIKNILLQIAFIQRVLARVTSMEILNEQKQSLERQHRNQIYPISNDDDKSQDHTPNLLDQEREINNKLDIFDFTSFRIKSLQNES